MVNFWRSLRFTIVFAILLGLIYPLTVTLVGQLLFPWQANGSLLKWQGRVVGSHLIAQSVTNLGLFQPRPSFVNYNADNSGASNYGPTNPALLMEIKKNMQQVEKNNPGVRAQQIPTSMVESSASGLDPDITVQDAKLQIPRISKTTGLSEDWLTKLVISHTVGRTFGIWGEPMLNVMTLNLAIEHQLHKTS